MAERMVLSDGMPGNIGKVVNRAAVYEYGLSDISVQESLTPPLFSLSYEYYRDIL